MTPTILIAGTWGQDDPWWKPDSPFWKEAIAHGLELIDEREPFDWTGDIDGILGKNTRWEDAGEKLLYYVRLKHTERRMKGLPGADPVNVIAHSHGGPVGLMAAARRLRIGTLITVATPVRKDNESVIAMAKPNIRRWVHLRSDYSDWWQWFGELMDGRLGIYRDFPQADCNVLEPGVGHSGLLDPALWTARGWWNWVRDETLILSQKGGDR
jgi:pimeloyl-ACP methyl ester carboxylesterase